MAYPEHIMGCSICSHLHIPAIKDDKMLLNFLNLDGDIAMFSFAAISDKPNEIQM